MKRRARAVVSTASPSIDIEAYVPPTVPVPDDGTGYDAELHRKAGAFYGAWLAHRNAVEAHERYDAQPEVYRAEQQAEKASWVGTVMALGTPADVVGGAATAAAASDPSAITPEGQSTPTISGGLGLAIAIWDGVVLAFNGALLAKAAFHIKKKNRLRQVALVRAGEELEAMHAAGETAATRADLDVDVLDRRREMLEAGRAYALEIGQPARYRKQIHDLVLLEEWADGARRTAMTQQALGERERTLELQSSLNMTNSDVAGAMVRELD